MNLAPRLAFTELAQIFLDEVNVEKATYQSKEFDLDVQVVRGGEAEVYVSGEKKEVSDRVWEVLLNHFFKSKP